MTLRNRPRVQTGSPKVLFGESKAASRSLISSAVRGAVYSTGGPGILLEGGIRIFMTGYANDNVYQYDMTTAGDLSTATYTQAFYIGSQEATPTDVFFKPDGLKMFVLGANGDDVNEYTLTSPYDISTASFVTSFSVVAQDSIPTAVFFSDDGAKMFIMGGATDTIYQYSLGTPWDISTLSYASKSFSVTANDSFPIGLSFNNDGSKMYFSGQGTGRIFEATLGTAFDVSTATVTDSTFVDTIYGFCFNESGTKMFAARDSSTDIIREYAMSTPFDSTTLSLTTSINVGPQDTNPRGVFLSRTVYQ